MTWIFLTTFLGLLIGIECRSIISLKLNENSSEPREAFGDEVLPGLSVSKDLDDAINLMRIAGANFNRNSKVQPTEVNSFVLSEELDIDKLLMEIAAKIVNAESNEEKVAQWLKQLKLTLQILLSDIQVQKSKRSKNRINEIGETETATAEGNTKVISMDGSNWVDNVAEFLDERNIDIQNNENIEHRVKPRYEVSSSSFAMTPENQQVKKDVSNESDQHSAKLLDDMLSGVQNEIGRIRQYFEKLCRKHHSGNHNDDQS